MKHNVRAVWSEHCWMLYHCRQHVLKTQYKPLLFGYCCFEATGNFGVKQ